MKADVDLIGINSGDYEGQQGQLGKLMYRL